MRYGHLLAGLLFVAIIFGALIAAFLNGSWSVGKVGVTPKGNGATVGATTTTFYTEPQEAASTTNTAIGPSFFTAPRESVSIVYTDSGFTPQSLAVPAGTTVTFENHTSHSFWPASDPYPDDDRYPQRGGCGGSAFDACAPVPEGGTWSLRFDRIGTWGYHDHLNPAHTGAITVK